MIYTWINWSYFWTFNVHIRYGLHLIKLTWLLWILFPRAVEELKLRQFRSKFELKPNLCRWSPPKENRRLHTHSEKPVTSSTSPRQPFNCATCRLWRAFLPRKTPLLFSPSPSTTCPISFQTSKRFRNFSLETLPARVLTLEARKKTTSTVIVLLTRQTLFLRTRI